MHSKSKKSKRQAKPRAQRRCQKLAKTRRQGQGTAHGPRPTRNQHEVAKRLLAGEVAMVGGTGWAFVEPFLAFLGEVGFFEGLRIDGARFIRQMAEAQFAAVDLPGQSVAGPGRDELCGPDFVS